MKKIIIAIVLVAILSAAGFLWYESNINSDVKQYAKVIEETVTFDGDITAYVVCRGAPTRDFANKDLLSVLYNIMDYISVDKDSYQTTLVPDATLPYENDIIKLYQAHKEYLKFLPYQSMKANSTRLGAIDKIIIPKFTKWKDYRQEPEYQAFYAKALANPYVNFFFCSVDPYSAPLNFGMYDIGLQEGDVQYQNIIPFIGIKKTIVNFSDSLYQYSDDPWKNLYVDTYIKQECYKVSGKFDCNYSISTRDTEETIMKEMTSDKVLSIYYDNIFNAVLKNRRSSYSILDNN